MEVNPCKSKKLSNMRSKGDGAGIRLDEPHLMDLEASLEYIGDDELVEVTPKNIRIRRARAHGATEITFLHCISAYPADPADFNLQTMVRLKHHNFHVGLSDHSLDNTAAIAATALGAIVIEKHLTLSRDYGGSDAKFSLEPDEFTAMVQAVRSAAKAMGTVQFGCRESEKDSYQYRRSVWLVKSIKRGEVITEGHLAILRPNYGANPSNFDIFVGMKAQQDLPAGTPMLMDYLK
jgi:N-acetylneuraminate synthase